MFIGYFVVVLVSGTVQSDSGLFSSKEECEARNLEVTKLIKNHPQVIAYHIECVDGSTFLTIKKKPGSEQKEG